MEGSGANEGRVIEVARRVLAARVAERAGVMERECGGDAGLRARVAAASRSGRDAAWSGKRIIR